MGTTTKEQYAEHAVTIKGAEVAMRFPTTFDQGDIAESVANIEGMIDDFSDAEAKGKSGAQRVLAEVRKVDPQCQRGHSLYYDDYVKSFKQVVRATANVSEAAISRYFSQLREELDANDPWYLDPNRTEHTSGGPAKGSTKVTSHGPVESVVIEDPDRFDIESLVTALAIRLKNLKGEELKNPVGFTTELEDLKDTAIPHGLGVAYGFIRSQS
jgi:hypothetical protein